jgi:hypothetical protein
MKECKWSIRVFLIPRTSKVIKTPQFMASTTNLGRPMIPKSMMLE